MNDLATILSGAHLVELTQPLRPETSLWPGSRPFAATTVATYDVEGCYARELEVPEHAGTHLDAPAHFARNGARVEEIPLDALVRPAVKLDVRPWVDGDPGATVGADAIRDLEGRDGVIEPGSAVLVHTGWDAYWAEPDRYLGAAGLAFPGLAVDAAELLVERGVAGVGIDTHSVDPGLGLERVPVRGAWLVVAPLLLADGSGAPARVFAIVPADA